MRIGAGIRLLAVSVCISACGDDSPSTAPTPPPTPTPTLTPTRVIVLSGSLAFGDVQVGTSQDAQLTIANTGTATLTITGMTGPSGYTANWTSGTIVAGGSQPVTVQFTPTGEQTYNGTLTVNGDQTDGNNTLPVSGRGVAPPGTLTQFGPGKYLVNTDIVAGRYFSDPTSGCFWERLSGLGGSTAEVIANEFIFDDPRQWIVDIAASDLAFNTDGECGTWFNTPRQPFQATIPAGVWLVGSQVATGVYRSTTSAGCYWERTRGFGGTLAEIIDNDFIFSSAAGPQRVEITSGDVGFQSDAACGTWTRDSTVTVGTADSVFTKSATELESNRQMKRQRDGLP